MTLREAAEALGVSVEAARKRVLRGTLPSEKGEDGRVYVLLDSIPPEREAHESGALTSGTEALIEELRDRVASLERRLDEEREARTEERRRHDTLMAQMVQRLPELEPPQASSQGERRESPVPEEGEGRQYEDTPFTEGGEARASQASGERKSWWRRLLGR